MTGKIAPHKGHEIDLVISDEKPLAVIEERKDPEQYARALKIRRDPYGSVFVTKLTGAEGPEAVVYKSVRQFHKYVGLLDNGRDELGEVGYARAMGALFGYSQEDVDAYIRDRVDCDCSKCTGRARYSPRSHAAFKASREASIRRTMYHA